MNQPPVINTPFTILTDSMEQNPFTFQAIELDKSEIPNHHKKSPLADQATWRVKNEFKALGKAHGDYSLKGFEGRVHVERKSLEDALGTILGWGDRRRRFVEELEYLESIESAAVVIECSLGYMIKHAESRGKKPVEENQKILFRQVLAWQNDYRVPWIFCDSRRMAEKSTFRILSRFYEKEMERRKKRGVPSSINAGVRMSDAWESIF